MVTRSMKHFFITGLPRSRTAWWANLMSTGEAFCTHEPGLTIDEWLTKYRPQETGRWPRYLGNSDGTLLATWREVQEAFPEAPWLVLLRPKDEAREATRVRFTEWGLETGHLDERFDELEQMLAELRAHGANLTELEWDAGNGQVLEAARYLAPQLTGLHPARIELLTKLNVQAKLPEWIDAH